jgi:ribosomal protein S18 acetylase RimI-like enzyme
MKDCFSKNELRTYSRQRKIGNFSNYHIDAINFAENIIGFLAWWDFGWIIFIEYLAVLQKYQNQGIGTQLINRLFSYKRPIILEVDFDNANAIAFYKKMGFVTNVYEYKPMELKGNIGCKNLQLMTWSSQLTKKEYFKFLRELRKPEYN